MKTQYEDNLKLFNTDELETCIAQGIINAGEEKLTYSDTM